MKHVNIREKVGWDHELLELLLKASGLRSKRYFMEIIKDLAREARIPLSEISYTNTGRRT